MDNLKFIVAINIADLRTRAGMTRSALGEQLDVPAETVARWERAEIMPDACELKRLSEAFGVSADALLSQPGEGGLEGNARAFDSRAIELIAVVGVWTAALAVFAVFWMLGRMAWVALVAALPASLVALLILNTLWEKGRHNDWIIGALVLSLLGTLYFCFASLRPWQLFLLAPPAELIVGLGFRVRRRP